MSLQKLKEQVEFYFGNSNYSRDKFMLARASENDGFIPISVLLTFKRLISMDATVDKIKEAVKESAVVELKDDSLRKVQTQEYKDYINDKDMAKRVVHMSGFRLDSTLDEIMAIISKDLAPVRVTMRREQNKHFSGSCFVEFSTEKEAEEALKATIEVPDNLNAETDSQVAKKQKQEPTLLKIISKEDYLASHPGKAQSQKEKEKEDKFAEKVKTSFMHKLYKYECDALLEVSDIKGAIANTAFADTSRKVVRMKYVENFEEKEFEVSKSTDGETKKYSLKLVKMPEDEAKAYVKNLKIKKLGGRKN